MARSLVERFVHIAEEPDANQALPVARLQGLQGEALAAIVSLTREPARRWLTLAEQIARRLHMGC